MRDGEKFLSVTKNSLQFSDDAAGTQLGSSAVLELLKEESDLMEDDDGPMSFMTPRWSSRKSVLLTSPLPCTLTTSQYS